MGDLAAADDVLTSRASVPASNHDQSRYGTERDTRQSLTLCMQDDGDTYMIHTIFSHE